MLHTYIKDGYFQNFKDKLKKTTMFGLLDWLKKALNYLNVIHTDPCCDPSLYRPMRYNSTTHLIETFNLTTNTWDTSLSDGEFIPINAENRVISLNSTQNGIIQYAKGSITVNDKLFITGTSLIASVSTPVLIYYPNCSDLSVYEITTLPFQVFSLCYDSNTNKVYGPMCSTISTSSNNIISIDINDPMNYTMTPITGIVFNHVGTGIITDGTYLYTSNISLNGVFAKIRISDLSLITTTAWTGSYGTLSGVISDDLLHGYFMSGTSNKLAKLNLTAMTFTELDYSAHCRDITDDIIYIPNSITGAPNYVMGGSFTRTPFDTSNIGGIIINVDDMTSIKQFDLLPSNGLVYDPSGIIYNTSRLNYIEVITVAFLLDVISGVVPDSRLAITTFIMRDNEPGEMVITDSGMFIVITNDNVFSKGSVFRIDFVVSSAPELITTDEVRYRWSY